MLDHLQLPMRKAGSTDFSGIPEDPFQIGKPRLTFLQLEVNFLEMNLPKKKKTYQLLGLEHLDSSQVSCLERGCLDFPDFQPSELGNATTLGWVSMILSWGRWDALAVGAFGDAKTQASNPSGHQHVWKFQED